MNWLEKHLLDMNDIDAPMVPYAADLSLMSETAAGLQKQLNALASFCEERQLTVNQHDKGGSRQSDMPGFKFVLNGAVVERVVSYEYLGFVARHQSNDVSDKLSSGSSQEGNVCHVAAVCTSWRHGPCYAVPAI